jgi:hypothetical protein
MSWVAAAIGGTAVLGSLAAEDAADTQAGAADRSTQLQREMFQSTKSDLQPWKQTGNLALNQIRGLLGLPSDEGSVADNPNAAFRRPFSMADFQESPAYQFNLQQGQKAIEKAAAARKTFYAPQTLQDIGRFSQGLASNEFQNAYSNYNTNMNNVWNRLYALSGSGQNAAAQTGAFGSNAANAMSDSITGGAAASAAGRVGAANALSGGVGQGLNAYYMNQILANNQRGNVPLSSIGAPNMGGDIYSGGWA